MQTLTEIKHLLESRGLRPKKSLGQNFLVDQNLIRKLVDCSGVGAGSLVLEVGPGTGTLTEELLARGCEVVACELDDDLAGLLAERIPAMLGPGKQHRFTLVHGDCLEGKRTLSPLITQALGGRPFALVANLPYAAATPLMSTLLVDHPECPTLAVTIQREVAERLGAAPGGKDYGALAVLAQSLAQVRPIATLPRECFWPRPDVTSAMVLLSRRAEPLVADPAALSAFLRDLFAHRRKQIGAVLGKGTDWETVAAAPGCGEITPMLRAEQLSVPQVVALGRALGRLEGRGTSANNARPNPRSTSHEV
ncbi:MAG: ribosomal RNA small subunit methyltransferase A [Phycisphaeraceae bacterium]|nr:ribosomal RNA small subunit methyltransferase A [Phycisphaeraceae bacterium]